MYLNLAKNNYLERLEKEQTFCEGCNKCVQPVHRCRAYSSLRFRFLADRFVEGTCPHCSADVSQPVCFLDPRVQAKHTSGRAR